MAVQFGDNQRAATARQRVVVAAVLGIVTTALVGYFGVWYLAPLVGWDVAASVFICWVWTAIWSMDGTVTAQHAASEDPSRQASRIVVLLTSIASLAAVGTVLISAGNSSQGSDKVVQVAFGVCSVVLAWVVVHTLATLNYAELYYQGTPGGVDFPGSREPSYKDFAYLAFTLGMTFQTSDTGFQTTEFRLAALRHSLLSYLFGTVIVATTINLIAGLTA